MTKSTERQQWDVPVRLDSEIDLWERQSEETDEHFAMFKAYLELTPRANPQTRTLGTRRLAELADTPVTVRDPEADGSGGSSVASYSLRHLKRLALRFSWEDRAKAWDWSKNETLQGILERRRRAILKNRLELTEEIRGLAVKVLGSLADDADRWKPRDVVAIIELMNTMENGLLSMTQLGGPEQPPQVVAASQFSVSLASAEAVEQHTMDVVDEILRRKARVLTPQAES